MLHRSLLSKVGGVAVRKSPRVWQDHTPGVSPSEASHWAPSDSSWRKRDNRMRKMDTLDHAPCLHEAILPHALLKVQFDQWSQLLEEGVSLGPCNGACPLDPGVLLTEFGGSLSHCRWGNVQ